METNKLPLQDAFLSALCNERISVSIYLVNGIRLMGQIEAFDPYMLLLKEGANIQAVYKHSVSTILPSRPVSLPFSRSATEVTVKKRTQFGLRQFSSADVAE